jgi:hypothetical protein
MDAKKNIDALEAEEREAVEATAGAEDQEDDQENSLILKFAKPYKFDGKEYTEVDLSGLEDATAADLSAVGKIVAKKGTVSPMPEMTMDFSQFMAARVAKLPVEFFTRLPAREAIKLKNIVTGFLYGGDGDN